MEGGTSVLAIAASLICNFGNNLLCLACMKRSRPVEVRFPESGIYVAESRHSDDFRMDWTRHPYLKLLYAWEGKGLLWTETKKHLLNAGAIAFIPAGILHRIVDSRAEPLSIYILCIRNPFVIKLAAKGRLLSCGLINNRMLGLIARRLIRDLLFEQTVNKSGADVINIGLVLELTGLLIRAHAGKLEGAGEIPAPRKLSRARVAAAIRDLEKHFYRPQSLENMADRVGLRPRRFSQIFRMIAGKSWPAFLCGKRIEHARRLLLETDRSIAAVCFECGFEDLSTFYRAFGKIESMSPNAWRRKVRPELFIKGKAVSEM